MALKEQSQRDVNYQRPQPKNSRKPVANYVQPPSKKPGKQGGKKASRRKDSTLDDDEDSEVEMLSISSGDEDDDKSRGAAGRSKASAGKEDDADWDGGEPDCWKRVNEAEVYKFVVSFSVCLQF